MDRRTFLLGLFATPVAATLDIRPAFNVVVSFTPTSGKHLIRSMIWSSQLKEMLLNDLDTMSFIARVVDTWEEEI